ncbi:TOMM precursor leader peptide-binding protein [Streptomyces sp. NPDC086023]|uniref:TOMM precursor leader peptide-binding protein n=1 Tax=Streptomyces sp. NPDC086023 TaxID=3365746 RepID=UPI0037D45EC2
MYPKVKPALARAWRDLQTVQFGVTPAHAVAFGPLDNAAGGFLDLLDGTRTLPALREGAAALGLPEGHADLLVRRLAGAGLLDDSTAGGPPAQAMRHRMDMVERLRPDLGSLSLVRREPGGALRGLAARRAVRVQVRGLGRVGALVAAVLAGAGVGRVEGVDGGVVEPGDVAPGGLPPDSVGMRRDDAVRQLVRAAAPAPPPRSGPAGSAGGAEPGLSLVVVAPRQGLAVYAPDPAETADWIGSGTPHLFAGVLEGTGVVGPLVLPGETACSGCLERDRVARDPAWPRLVTQWRSGRGRAGPSCDVGVATAVAGLAAAHALAFLDGRLPASAGARWEVAVPELDWRRDPVPAHSDCPCGAARSGEGERTSVGREPQDTMAR